MYHSTSFNTSLNFTVNGIDQRREAPASFVIFASVTIAFAAIVIIVSGTTILYLCRESHRHSRPSMSQSPEACGDETVARMCSCGFDRCSVFGHRSDKSGTFDGIARKGFFMPATPYTAVNDGLPSELGGISVEEHYRLDQKTPADWSLDPTTGNSVVESYESRDLQGLRSGMVNSDLPSGGFLQSIMPDSTHRVPQMHHRSLIPEAESLNYHVTRAAEPPHIDSTQPDRDRPLPVSEKLASSVSRVLRKRHKLQRTLRSSGRPLVPVFRGPSPHLDNNRRSRVEEGYSQSLLPGLSQGPPTSAVSAFPSPDTFSPPSQCGSTKNERSSLSEFHPPQPARSIAATQNSTVGDQYCTIHPTSFFTSRRPFSVGLPKVVPQDDSDLTELPSLDPSPTSATLSEPATESRWYSPDHLANAYSPTTAIASSPDIDSLTMATDWTNNQSQ